MSANWISELDGLHFVRNPIHSDSRGTFSKLTDASNPIFSDYISTIAFAKNLKEGTLRGLHFQSGKYAEEKVVRCIRGRIFEVFVDLRRNKPSYGQWTHRIMSSDDEVMAFIPKGIAHGYLTLEDHTWLLYGISSEYNLASAHRIHYGDVRLAIDWPRAISSISRADENALTWRQFEKLNLSFCIES